MPSGVEFELPDGVSLYAGIRDAGLPIAAACDAEGICGRFPSIEASCGGAAVVVPRSGLRCGGALA